MDAGKYIDMGSMNRNAAYCEEHEICQIIVKSKADKSYRHWRLRRMMIHNPLQEALR